MEDSELVPDRVVVLARSLPGAPSGYVLPAGADRREVSACEHRMGMEFPPDLRAWIEFSNGPLIGPGGFFGVRPEREFCDLEACASLTPEWAEHGWIPVGGDGCGNYYAVRSVEKSDQPRSPVVFFEMVQSTTEPCYVVASNLWTFIEQVLLEEQAASLGDLGDGRWPFDSAFTLAIDPPLADMGEFGPLPWET